MKFNISFNLILTFTVSVDAIHPEVTTGISAGDRAITIQMLVDEKTRPEQLVRPGHIIPLKAKNLVYMVRRKY